MVRGRPSALSTRHSLSQSLLGPLKGAYPSPPPLPRRRRRAGADKKSKVFWGRRVGGLRDFMCEERWMEELRSLKDAEIGTLGLSWEVLEKGRRFAATWRLISACMAGAN